MGGQVATSNRAELFNSIGVASGSNLHLGLSLGRLLELAPLTPEQGVMVGAAILNQISVASAGDISAEDLELRHIRVYPDGSVAILGKHRSSIDDGDPRAVLRAAGRAICAALGVAPEPDAEPEFTAAEAVALPLVVQARAMAVGAAGADPVAATHVYLERAGRLGAAERLECSREELSALVSRLLQSAAPAAAPLRPAPLVAIPTAVSRRRAGWLLPAIGAIGVALLVGAVVVAGAARPPKPVTTRAQPSPGVSVAPSVVTSQDPPAASPPLIALPLPAFAPTSAPPIRSVAASLGGPCSASAGCSVGLSIAIQPPRSSLKLAWKLEIVDTCSGAVVERPGGSFTAHAGWSRVEVTTKVQMPAMKAPAIVAVTTAPTAAQSVPVSLPGGAC